MEKPSYRLEGVLPSLKRVGREERVFKLIALVV